MCLPAAAADTARIKFDTDRDRHRNRDRARDRERDEGQAIRSALASMQQYFILNYLHGICRRATIIGIFPRKWHRHSGAAISTQVNLSAASRKNHLQQTVTPSLSLFLSRSPYLSLSLLDDFHLVHFYREYCKAERCLQRMWNVQMGYVQLSWLKLFHLNGNGRFYAPLGRVVVVVVALCCSGA